MRQAIFTVSVVTMKVHPDAAGKPALNSLCSQLSQAQDNSGAIDVFKPAFDHLLKSRECVAVLNSELVKLAKNALYASKSSFKNTFLIFQNPAYSLFLQIAYPEARKTVSSVSSAAIFGTQSKNGGLQYRNHALPKQCNIDIFDPTVQLVKKENLTVDSSDLSLICRATDIPVLTPSRPVVILKLIENFLLPYQWVFDRYTLEPLFISASFPSASRYRTVIELIELFGKTGCGDDLSIKTLVELAENPYHFIRWRAVQALFLLDPKVGLQAVLRATRDPHPHVAAAAKSSLTRIASLRGA